MVQGDTWEVVHIELAVFKAAIMAHQHAEGWDGPQPPAVYVKTMQPVAVVLAAMPAAVRSSRFVGESQLGQVLHSIVGAQPARMHHLNLKERVVVVVGKKSGGSMLPQAQKQLASCVIYK